MICLWLVLMEKTSNQIQSVQVLANECLFLKRISFGNKATRNTSAAEGISEIPLAQCCGVTAMAFRATLIATIWGFPSMGYPNNGWFIRENPTKIRMMKGIPLFQETPISMTEGSFQIIPVQLGCTVHDWVRHDLRFRLFYKLRHFFGGMMTIEVDW